MCATLFETIEIPITNFTVATKRNSEGKNAFEKLSNHPFQKLYFTFIVVELKMKFGFYRVWLLTEIGFWRAFSHEILSRCLNAELNIRLIILYSRQI